MSTPKKIFLTLLCVAAPLAADAQSLSLEAAIQTAIETDPWLTGSQHREAALRDEAAASSTLPNPQVSLRAANLPTDGFDINQEPMTQLAVGLSQMFPRGSTLKLNERQKHQKAQQQPLMREDRKAKTRAMVTTLWLELYRAERSVRLIEADRDLFEQLVDITVANYSTAVGRARQQDVVRAQLELTRLDDRITQLNQQKELARRRLSEWIGQLAAAPLSGSIPTLTPTAPVLIKDESAVSNQDRHGDLQRHPAILALDQQIDATATGIELAEQKYKPEWGISAQYGYRDDDPFGRDRADFLSVGVTFDLPLFTGNRQDRQLSAAVSRTEAARTERLLLLRDLNAQLQARRVELQRQNERLTLYRQRLLPEMEQQAMSSLSAYNNDDGDFAEAVRARIDELNAKIEALTIEVDRAKTVAQINYLLTQASPAIAR